MSEEEFRSKVPENVQKALEESPPVTQPPGSPTCYNAAEENRVKYQEQLIPASKEKLTTSGASTWNDRTAKGVMNGRIATVHGYGTATTHSEWSEDHAVTVLSPTKDWVNKPLSKDTEFVVVDPDTRHHPATWEAERRGSSKPRHHVRTMTHEQLMQVAAKELEPGSDGNVHGVPVVTQAIEKPKSWSEWLFGSKDNS